MGHAELSIILPARDEAQALQRLVPALKASHPHAEIIVVDDGSGDETAAVAERHGARVVRHAYSKGNGAAVKTGARSATGEVLVFMDADGQHRVGDIARLLERLGSGFHMVVGARNARSQATLLRRLGNAIYNRLASWMVGERVVDLTSGLRVVSAEKFREFIYLLPNGFSYPTTVTMAFFRAGYSVGYLPIEADRASGESHIRLVRDGTGFLLIIFKIAALYSPLKIFFPVSLLFFSIGLSYYLYTFTMYTRFTNMRRAAVRYLGAGFPHRPGGRADHNAHLQGGLRSVTDPQSQSARARTAP